MTAPYRFFDPLLSDEQADTMLRLCERYGSYGTHSEEGIQDGFGENVSQRHDAALNFVKTGGRFGRQEELRTLVARTNYFREEYAYDQPLVEGVEPFLHHEGFYEAAREIFGRPIVEPKIVYANLLVPGQELAIHTDVPEFRGVTRRTDPQWLLVAMHHSGLFERWRKPIATGVAWFGDPRGGEFAFYPDGPRAPARSLDVRHNTAILLDTDLVFHGVDRVTETHREMPAMGPDVKLVHEGDGRWRTEENGGVLDRYGWEDLRFSVSWKAYCYADEAERHRVAQHTDDLSRKEALDVLIADLRAKGRLDADPPSDDEIALTIIDEYIRFPTVGS
ncbi:MAG: hypothetical protein ACR2P8_11200 [Myxococcota bacterium]